MNNQLTFKSTPLTLIDENWLASSDIARALGHSDTKRVAVLHNRHKDEFSGDMSKVLNLNTSGNLQKRCACFTM